MAVRAGSDPGEAIEKVKERLARSREKLPPHAKSLSYTEDLDWERHVHELFDLSWPCAAAAEFDQVWAEILDTMRSQGLRVGRQSYGGDDDADPGLGRALWCLIRHLRPQHVVETGVAHGISSRCILEALDRNHAGHLWSIDLPPLTIPERRPEIAAAVPEDRRERWTYIEGSSRRRLPNLLRELGEIQLFLHDSWHSTRNTRWELMQAWPMLSPGGGVVADDIDNNWAFALFARSLPEGASVNCSADDGQRLFGVARKATTCHLAGTFP